MNSIVLRCTNCFDEVKEGYCVCKAVGITKKKSNGSIYGYDIFGTCWETVNNKTDQIIKSVKKGLADAKAGKLKTFNEWELNTKPKKTDLVKLRNKVKRKTDEK